MNPFRRAIQFFAEDTIPVGGRIFKTRSAEFNNGLDYSYGAMMKLLEDERISAIVALVASAVQKSYGGVYIEPADKYIDEELSDKELDAINVAEQFLKDIKIEQLFFDFAWELTLLADVFAAYSYDGNKGITGIRLLPLNAVVVLEKEEQESSINDTIYEEKVIGVRSNVQANFGIGSTNTKFYKAEDVLHISYKKSGVWRKDIDGRITYGIYSIPPLACLQRLVAWKNKTIENDIVWKNRLMPRLHWKLKMPSIVPSKYIGTQAEKVEKAKTDGKKVINDFKEGIMTENADQDFITSDSVEGKMIEANSTNYHAPNETINQINNLLNTPMGIPNGFLGGTIGASQGMEMSAIFSNIRILKISKSVADGVLTMVRKHLKIVRADLEEDIIKRINIHVNTQLSTEKYEMAKTALAMAESKAYTKREIRLTTGHEPLPQLPKEVFPDVSTDVRSTGNQIKSDILSEEPGQPKNNASPQGQRNAMEGA